MASYVNNSLFHVEHRRGLFWRVIISYFFYMADGTKDSLALTGEEIREIRRALGMNQAKFAAAVGAAGQVTVCRWERGDAYPHRIFREKIFEVAHAGLSTPGEGTTEEGQETPSSTG